MTFREKMNRDGKAIAGVSHEFKVGEILKGEYLRDNPANENFRGTNFYVTRQATKEEYFAQYPGIKSKRKLFYEVSTD